jgi:hypothetical protein
MFFTFGMENIKKYTKYFITLIVWGYLLFTHNFSFSKKAVPLSGIIRNISSIKKNNQKYE